MSQAFAADLPQRLPLPVALALAALLLVLLAVTAILVSLRKPARVRAPERGHGSEAKAPQDEEAGRTFRLGHLRIDGPGELSEPPRGRLPDRVYGSGLIQSLGTRISLDGAALGIDPDASNPQRSPEHDPGLFLPAA